MRARPIFALLLLALVSNVAVGQTLGMLGFQGLLKDAGGDPINGTVDLEFRIFDAEVGGNLVEMDGDGVVEDPGDDVTSVLGLSVIDGIVATKFGPVHPAAFPGTQRWLELSVDDGGGFEALSRVEMVTAPAASEQVNRPGSGTAAIEVDINGNVGIGTTAPGAKLEVNGALKVGGSETGTAADDIKAYIQKVACENRRGIWEDETGCQEYAYFTDQCTYNDCSCSAGHHMCTIVDLLSGGFASLRRPGYNNGPPYAWIAGTHVSQQNMFFFPWGLGSTLQCNAGAHYMVLTDRNAPGTAT